MITARSMSASFSKFPYHDVHAKMEDLLISDKVDALKNEAVVRVPNEEILDELKKVYHSTLLDTDTKLHQKIAQNLWVLSFIEPLQYLNYSIKLNREVGVGCSHSQHT